VTVITVGQVPEALGVNVGVSPQLDVALVVATAASSAAASVLKQVVARVPAVTVGGRSLVTAMVCEALAGLPAQSVADQVRVMVMAQVLPLVTAL
jgi:hypothetical protein